MVEMDRLCGPIRGCLVRIPSVSKACNSRLIVGRDSPDFLQMAERDGQQVNVPLWTNDTNVNNAC